MCSYGAAWTMVQLYRSQTVSRPVMSLSTNTHLKILLTLGIKMTSPSLKSTDKDLPIKFPSSENNHYTICMLLTRPSLSILLVRGDLHLDAQFIHLCEFGDQWRNKLCRTSRFQHPRSSTSFSATIQSSRPTFKYERFGRLSGQYWRSSYVKGLKVYCT